MVMLGLIIVFPKSLDLMDMIIAENTHQQKIQLYSDKYPKKTNDWGFFSFFVRNVAPTSEEMRNSLLRMPDIVDVVCIGKIPKITFDEKSAKISPTRPSVKAQVITRNLTIPTLKTGNIHLHPEINYIGSAMPIAQWLGSNSIKGWSYSIQVNKKEFLSQTAYLRINKSKTRSCD